VTTQLGACPTAVVTLIGKIIVGAIRIQRGVDGTVAIFAAGPPHAGATIRERISPTGLTFVLQDREATLLPPNALVVVNTAINIQVIGQLLAFQSFVGCFRTSRIQRAIHANRTLPAVGCSGRFSPVWQRFLDTLPQTIIAFGRCAKIAVRLRAVL
jgi:hypothetical protein